jgi:hypothetical protein
MDGYYIIIPMNSRTQTVEKLGAAFGILGAFLAAAGFGIIGYPCFTLSSVLLVYTSIMQKNYNLLSMQAAFLAANILGIFTFTV